MNMAAAYDGELDTWDSLSDPFSDEDELDADPFEDPFEDPFDPLAADPLDPADPFDPYDPAAADPYDPYDSYDPYDPYDPLDPLADDPWEDPLDEGLDDFAYQPASGLYVPNHADPLAVIAPPRSLIRSVNPLVLQSLDAADSDEFFKRLVGGVRRIARGVGRFAKRAVRTVGRGLKTVGKFAGPLLQRALPLIQKVAGFAGPWGRVISAGIGAAQGLLEGKGLKGALAGAVGGLIPGVGGKLASAVLSADGADDDAALDALADMTEVGATPGAIALPLGAGLAARVATRAGLPGTSPAAARAAEPTMLRAATQIQGSAAKRLRIMRAIGRFAAHLLRRRGQGGIPASVQRAVQLILSRLRHESTAGTSTPAAARRRLQMRAVVMRRMNAGPGSPAGVMTYA